MDTITKTWALIDEFGYITDTNDSQLPNNNFLSKDLYLPSTLLLNLNKSKLNELADQEKLLLSYIKHAKNTKTLCILPVDVDNMFVQYLLTNGFSYLITRNEFPLNEMLMITDTYNSYISINFQRDILYSVQNNLINIGKQERPAQLIVNRWKAHPLFTKRELDVLQAIISYGADATNLSKLFSVSVSNIKTYKSRLIRRLMADNMNQLIYKCIQRGIIEVD